MRLRIRLCRLVGRSSLASVFGIVRVDAAGPQVVEQLFDKEWIALGVFCDTLHQLGGHWLGRTVGLAQLELNQLARLFRREVRQVHANVMR